jgi:two-component system, chemotaxis family, chemotaxis protein CheY
MPSDLATVLLVDDSAAMRAFVTSTLEADGAFSVTAVSNAFEALKLLPRTRFDLVITDINMPDINGLELIRYIRDSPIHGKVPLVIISTDGGERDRQRAMKLGADAYLVKPFGPEALIELASRFAPGGREGSRP